MLPLIKMAGLPADALYLLFELCRPKLSFRGHNHMVEVGRFLRDALSRDEQADRLEVLFTAQKLLFKNMSHQLTRQLERLRAEGFFLYDRYNPAYPARLLYMDDPPPYVFMRAGQGKKPPVCPHGLTALVGTRRPSPAAFTVTRQLTALSRGIISGLALGIDAFAHYHALRSGLPNIAVLGCGAGRVYPSENRRLYDAMVERPETVIISESAPFSVAHGGNFPRRNRLISALADRVIIVEAPPKSGALITLRYALEQGKEPIVVLGRPLTSNRGAWRAAHRGEAHVLHYKGEKDEKDENDGQPGAQGFDSRLRSMNGKGARSVAGRTALSEFQQTLNQHSTDRQSRANPWVSF